MATNLRFIFMFLFFLECFGLIGWPLTRRIFTLFPDRGWGFSKLVGIALTGWFLWIFSSLHILPFSLLSILVVALGLTIIGWILLPRLWPETDPPTRLRPWVLRSEIIFVSMIAVWSFLRGFKPSLQSTEKFTDLGFLIGILKTDYFPPIDSWLAREPLNYYYYGQYLSALLVRISGIPPEYGYNLCMVFLFSACMTGAFTLGAGLTFLLRRDHPLIFRLSGISGALCMFFVNLSGNLQTMIYWPQLGSKYFYAAATRFIPFTIHEFPFYSYVVNDLHAHLTNLPYTIMILGFLGHLWIQIKKENDRFPLKKILPSLIACTFVIGQSYAINSWDFLIYLFAFGLLAWLRFSSLYPGPPPVKQLFQARVLMGTFLICAAVLATSIFLFLPFWISFQRGSFPLTLVPGSSRSTLWELFIVWGVFLPVLLTWIGWRLWHPIQAKKQTQEHLPAPFWSFFDFLGGFLFLIILAVEVIYFKDIYSGHLRANTMFKFYFQGWLIAGIWTGVSMPFLWEWIGSFRRPFYFSVRTLMILALLSGGVCTYKILTTGMKMFSPPWAGLDGATFLREEQPDDYRAIQWLYQNVPGRPTLLEAVGESYTGYARVSTFTGLPTVLGWPVHEQLWHGSYFESMKPKTLIEQQTLLPDTVATRLEEVRIMYETDDLRIARQLLKKYGVQYVYLGEMERKKYPKLNEAKFRLISRGILYESGSVRIYRLY